ncbi:metal-dependent hydrolase [Salinicoccus sp. RF5]|uniref:metal-dependent hydrolase n=1 Tax=Salinicoccus sp. RF5 TaxID=2748874 RepID=UPI001E61C3ED|nr:metal-dependent hydrolase [Salinicoccus sp. RF5]MCC4721543.1 metal-dependent hydrolase [Salinicoccus sp. RF5]
MKLSYHGHSIIQLENNDTKVIVDPFINGNELTDLEAGDVKADYILLTHGHNDHVGDTVEIAKNNDATVVAPVELAGYLEGQGLETIGMNIGGRKSFEFGSIKFVHAFHSSSFTDDDGKVHYTGMPTGIIIEAGEKKIYHAGDTGIFGDMKLISDLNGPFDVAFVPIGDHFTMGIEDAAYATDELIRPKIAVPVHYDTFPPIKQDAEAFKNSAKTEVQVLKPGETVDFQ